MNSTQRRWAPAFHCKFSAHLATKPVNWRAARLRLTQANSGSLQALTFGLCNGPAIPPLVAIPRQRPMSLQLSPRWPTPLARRTLEAKNPGLASMGSANRVYSLSSSTPCHFSDRSTDLVFSLLSAWENPRPAPTRRPRKERKPADV